MQTYGFFASFLFMPGNLVPYGLLVEVQTLTRKLFTGNLKIDHIDLYYYLSSKLTTSNYKLLDFRHSEQIDYLILKIGCKYVKLEGKDSVYSDFQNLHLVQILLGSSKDKPAILANNAENIDIFEFDKEYTSLVCDNDLLSSFRLIPLQFSFKQSKEKDKKQSIMLSKKKTENFNDIKEQM